MYICILIFWLGGDPLPLQLNGRFLSRSQVVSSPIMCLAIIRK
jgi:hypothetical protein